ncbi:hypothetical protein ES703_113580 [subsurface metagenome]
MTGPQHADLNSDGQGNAVSDNVLFIPWLPKWYPTAPTVVNVAASSLRTTSATLSGSLDDLGSALSVEVSFDWGTTTAYGNETSVQEMTDSGSFTASLTGLSSDTNYHFRAKAVGDGTSYGEDMGFATVRVVGGGGGIKKPPPGTTKVSGDVDSKGVFEETVTATSKDKLCHLTIPEGTVGLTEEQRPLRRITMEVMDEPPPPPEDADVIGLPYDFGPDGTTFNPPITLTWSYDPDVVPEGLDLVIAYWDGDEWVECECTCDPETHCVTACVCHFTCFAIFGYEVIVPPVIPVIPAEFSVSDLTISPTEVNIGEAVSISLMVATTGGELGSYKVTLKINGVVEATKEVTVHAGFSKEVTFTTLKDVAGTYSVDVDGLTGSFTVKEKPVPTPPVAPTVPPPPGINWAILGPIIAVAVFLAIFLPLRQRRRRAG